MTVFTALTISGEDFCIGMKELYLNVAFAVLVLGIIIKRMTAATH